MGGIDDEWIHSEVEKTYPDLQSSMHSKLTTIDDIRRRLGVLHDRNAIVLR